MEKHDAMWGSEAGEYIAQLLAEIARLRAELAKEHSSANEDRQRHSVAEQQSDQQIKRD
jgi:hypothetical protein